MQQQVLGGKKGKYEIYTSKYLMEKDKQEQKTLEKMEDNLCPRNKKGIKQREEINKGGNMAEERGKESKEGIVLLYAYIQR